MKQEIKDGNKNIQISVGGNFKGDLNVNQSLIIGGPYTIPCPNCGKPVSRTADACGICQHRVREHLERIEAKRAADRQMQILKRRLFGLSLAALFVFGLWQSSSAPWTEYLLYALFIVGGLLLWVISEMTKISQNGP